MKKFVVAGIFLGGGILLLRTILPKLNQKSTTSLDVELIDFEPPKSVIRTDTLIDTEEKFNNAFTIVTGVDADGNSIESSDPNDWGVTWSQVKEEMDKL